jgi:hypothetical protein
MHNPKRYKRNPLTYYAMRTRAMAVLLLLSFCVLSPVLAASEDRYSYIKVEDVQIQLDNGTAVIHVNYSVDDGTRFLFFLLGKQDLKNKLLKILNYEDAQVTRIDLSSADFTVSNASFSYGKGIYWYPSHDFNVVIPSLTVSSPQATKTFSMTNEFRGGMGYFDRDGENKMPVQDYPEISAIR